MLWTHSKQGGYFELDMNDQVVLDVSIESVGKIIVCVCGNYSGQVATDGWLLLRSYIYIVASYCICCN